MKRKIAAGLLSMASLLAHAADDEPADIIKSRQANLRDLGGAFKGVTDELKKSQPQLLTIKQYAKQINELAQEQKFWFPAGSGKEAGIKTAAKDDIWIRKLEFQQARDTLASEAEAFVNAISSGDMNVVRAQHKSLGKACAGCHKVFREKDENE